MNRRTFSDSPRRSSGGPAGRHGPWGSGRRVRRRRTGASRERRLQGPRHHDGDRGFFVSWTRPPTRRPLHSDGGTRRMDTMIILGDGALGRRRSADALAAAARRPDPRRRPRPAAVRDARSGAAGRGGPRRRGIARRRGRRPTWPPRSRPAAGGSSSPRRAGPRTARPWSELMRDHGATAVAASNFSLGVALFGRLVETAVALFGPLDDFDPYLLEWHRRGKRDRPSGTATTSPRGSSPATRAWTTGMTSRSCRSAPGHRRACTWSASTPPARPSSSG